MKGNSGWRDGRINGVKDVWMEDEGMGWSEGRLTEWNIGWMEGEMH